MKNEIENNRLHDLIKGLSKSDKAYLKKYSKIFISQGETKHKIYYAIVERMEQYSSEVLKKKLEKHGGFRSFKNTEQEIYNQILEDLVILKSKKRPTWQYYVEHMKLGYLFLEGKFEEALRQFKVLDVLRKKTKNTTINFLYHKFHYHHLASLTSVRNSEDLKKFKDSEDMLRQGLEDIKLEFLLEAAVFNFNNYRGRSFNKTRTQFLGGLATYKKEYVDVLPKALETDKLKMLSVYYHFFCSYYSITRNIEPLDTYSEKFYESYKVDRVKSQFYHEYINALHYRIEFFILTKNRKVFELLKEFNAYLDSGNILELKTFMYAMYCQLALIANNKFREFQELQIFIEKEQETYLKELSSSEHPVVLAVDFQWALAFFNLRKFKEAQVYLDKIFESFKKINEASNKILISAQILDILIHFELKNFENIKYYIDNLENEMSRKNQLIQFDKEFFRHLRKINQQLYSQKPVDREAFQDFLKNQQNEDRMESYLYYLDVEEWLQKL